MLAYPDWITMVWQLNPPPSNRRRCMTPCDNETWCRRWNFAQWARCGTRRFGSVTGCPEFSWGVQRFFPPKVREYMQNNSGITGHRQLRGASGNQAGLGRASEVSQRFALRLCQGVPKAWAWTRFGDAMQLHQGTNTFGEIVFRDAIWPWQMFDHLVVCPHTSFIHVSFLLRPHNGSTAAHRQGRSVDFYPFSLIVTTLANGKCPQGIQAYFAPRRGPAMSRSLLRSVESARKLKSKLVWVGIILGL